MNVLLPGQDVSDEDDDDDDSADDGRPSSARRRLKALSAIQVTAFLAHRF